MTIYPRTLRSRICVAILFIAIAGSLYTRMVKHLLITAVEHGDTAGVRTALRLGASPQTSSISLHPLDFDVRVNYVYCPVLTEAASRGHTEVARVLLDAGADLFATGVDCIETIPDALVVASGHGHENVVRLLLSRSAGTRPERLQEALCWAASAGQATVVRLLLAHGADARLPDEQGHSFLYHAVHILYFGDDHPEQMHTIRILSEAGSRLTPGDFQAFQNTIAVNPDFVQRWEKHDPSTNTLREFWSLYRP